MIVNRVQVPHSSGQLVTVSTGALPSWPDLRDYNDRQGMGLLVTANLGVAGVTAEELPSDFDLSADFSEVEDQGALGSCTAHAGVGLLEYMQKHANGEYVDLSRMFLYNATKYLLGWSGDSGAHLRATAAAMRLFGCPPEDYYVYDSKYLDIDPSSYQASLAKNYQGLTYFRHDGGTNTPPECALLSVKKYIAAFVPSMFAFYGFDSFSSGKRPGDVPLPTAGESAKWAHAVDAVGYDDEYEITNTRDGSKSVGAVRFRNSWSKGWGNAGYGWIPYAYFLRRYCWDMWSILSFDWVGTKQFGFNLGG